MSRKAGNMKTAAAAIGVLLLAAACGYGQELRRYDETVTLAADGSAAVRIVLEVERRGDAAIWLPVPAPTLRSMRATGISLLSPQPVKRGGRHFLELALPPAAGPGHAAEVEFTADGYFRAGGRPGPFHTRKLAYRFVNVSFAAVGEFSAALVLPPGCVFNAIGRFVPETRGQGTAVPFAIVRRDGRLAGRITLAAVGLGDEVALECTVRPARRSRWLLLGLAVLALAWLVFFRDVLRGRENGSGGA